MAKMASCHTCVYAQWDAGLWLRTLGSGWPAGPTCGNQPQFPGRMKECPPGPACRNYRPRPPTPTGENVKLVPLTHGFYAYVDAADFERVNQWHWRMHGGYAARIESGKVIYMHREIMKPPKGMVVDHVNGNGFDNTRANLRNVTRRQNAHNMSKHVGTNSLYKGVGPGRKEGTWYARIGWKGAYLRAGPFTDEAEAGRAYDRMAVELFGEVARLNFPEEWPAERRAQVYAEAQEKREALRAKAARAKRRKSRKEKKKKGPRAAARAKPRKKGVNRRK
jgi:hypothetical protein